MPPCDDAVVAYRDERDAMKSRIAELEGELSAAHDTIARLQGASEPEVVADDVDRFTGVRRFLNLERELPHEVSNAGLVAIADLLNARIPGGSVSQVGDTLTHRKGSYELRLSRNEQGRTTIRLRGDYRPARTQLAIGSPGIALLGGVFTAGLAAAISAGNPVAMAVGAVLGAIGGFALLRRLIKRALDKDRQTLVGAFEGVVRLANEHRSEPARKRIATSDAQQLAESEALAIEEAEHEQARHEA